AGRGKVVLNFRAWFGWAGARLGIIPRPAYVGPKRLTVDDQELARCLVQDVRPIRAADHDVLDPDPESVLEVDPRLDAEGHARAQRVGAVRHEIRILVAVEPDPVPEPMDERVAIA